jgi:hypothetical protein
MLLALRPLQAYTLSAQPGAVAATGAAANLLAARMAPASSTTLVFTGAAALLLDARVLPASAGTLAETGVADRFSLTLPTAAAAYVLSGPPATVLKSSQLSAGAGACALGMQPAALFAVRQAPASAGALVAAGADAALRADRILVAESAELSIDAAPPPYRPPASPYAPVAAYYPQRGPKSAAPIALAAEPAIITVESHPARLAKRARRRKPRKLVCQAQAATIVISDGTARLEVTRDWVAYDNDFLLLSA